MTLSHSWFYVRNNIQSLRRLVRVTLIMARTATPRRRRALQCLGLPPRALPHEPAPPHPHVHVHRPGPADVRRLLGPGEQDAQAGPCRSRANLSLASLHSHRNARANLHLRWADLKQSTLARSPGSWSRATSTASIAPDVAFILTPPCTCIFHNFTQGGFIMTLTTAPRPHPGRVGILPAVRLAKNDGGRVI
jgi:hypothetical protein